MKYLFSLLLVMLLTGCVTGEKVASINPGMSQNEVVQVLGKPDGFRQSGDYTIYKYTNRLISGWSWDRADYSFVFKDTHLVEYGAGEVRERNVGGIHSVFVYQL
ncbi:outer membrane protein assembly factor BamE [Endozoicomonas sp. Mp262]|uniref:outer membrane protein assembly factor BamE n=1 Tax=Endozoicomonas sp. Mp262 TaxID=2919499 RepID=UPI0021DAE85E